MIETLRNFLKLEASGGIVLVIAAALAIITANSPLAGLYSLFIDLPVEIRIGPLHIAKPLLLWINDGFMAIFFFLIGLELKREVLDGELSDARKIVLPAFGAVGGMAVPAAIYAAFNWSDAVALKGWAIPAATDIAFALGVLALLGSRVPLSLRVFLVTIAIFDDVGAIAIIALFYTSDLSLSALAVALALMVALLVLNRRGVTANAPYLLLGIVMWVSLLKSGVHATLAGIALALFIPMRDPKQPERSPLRTLEHDLHTAVAFGILPLFAFANAGISLADASLEYLSHPVPLGIAAGLFVGKQLGIFAACWLGVMLGLARRPEGVSWPALYGTALLCGIGFTMSLFIGTLAFEETGVNQLFDERLGIIAGSILSGVAGYLVLHWTYPKKA
ncbi:MAG: sodium:proton antiporter [Betaproteobacteria bacterium SG8_41]|jgi:NhaA family Na+:H+ antiporter|nr:MAG: sodium:proton antiporter [Betaproteobacteria bacterium SG8_41]